MQKDYFGEVYSFIRGLKGETCNRVRTDLKPFLSALRKLNVFCDERGLLRVHGRELYIQMLSMTADFLSFYQNIISWLFSE